MKTIRYTDHWLRTCLFLLVFSSFMFWPVAGLALEACNVSAENICNSSPPDEDCDHDGFTNAQECDPDGVNGQNNFFETAGSNKLKIYGYLAEAVPTDAIILNPVEPDLFFIADYEPGGLMFDALESAKAQQKSALTIYSDAFKINTHQVNKVNCGGDDSRVITGSMRAALIIESTRTDIYAGSIGITPSMTVSTTKDVASTIFTQKIANEVNNVTCVGGGCTIKTDRKTVVASSDGNDNKPIINYYILQVISHEVGHSSRLAASPPTLPSSSYHYDGSDTVMDPAVTFKSSKNGGTYTMPNQFNMATDPGALTIYDAQ